MSGRTRALLSALAFAARYVVAAVFLLAALPKVADPQSFLVAIENYHMVPTSWAPLIALALPITELLVGFLLIVGWMTRAASLACFAMLAVFIAAMSQALVRGIDLSCGCFGAEASTVVTWASVARNAGFAVLALISATFGRVAAAPPISLLLTPHESRRA